MNIPDGIEPVRGYRAWYLEGGYLKPTNSDYLWQPGDNEALCYASRGQFNKKVWKNVDGELKVMKVSTHGLIPEPSCNCGFWMLKTPQALIDRIIHPKPRDDMFHMLQVRYFQTGPVSPLVVGQVRGWGRVLPGENGWRTEFAAVESLVTVEREQKILTGEALEAAAALYNVPIVYEEAFDGPPPPTAKEKALMKKQANQNWVSLHDDLSKVR